MDGLEETIFNFAHSMRRSDVSLADRVFYEDATVTGQQPGIIFQLDFRSQILRLGRMRLKRKRIASQYRIDRC